MAKLKVFYGSFTGFLYDTKGAGKAGRDILIATTSQKRLAMMLDLSLYEVRKYWNVSLNESDIALALGHPEKLVIFKSRFYGDRDIADIADSVWDNRRRNNPKSGESKLWKQP